MTKIAKKKNFKLNNIENESKFAEKMIKIMPCCIANERNYFENLILADLPKSKYSFMLYYYYSLLLILHVIPNNI